MNLITLKFRVFLAHCSGCRFHHCFGNEQQPTQICSYANIICALHIALSAIPQPGDRLKQFLLLRCGDASMGFGAV